MGTVILIGFLVNFLLLLGAERLCGHPPKMAKCLLAAVLGGVYSGACLLPGFHFLGNTLWHTVSFGLMAAIAYGLTVSALRRGLVFALLSLALVGLVAGMTQRGIVGVMCATGVLFAVCFLGVPFHLKGKRYIPVELSYGGKCIALTALLDTGNTLRDPLTGAEVLVVGAEVAEELTGLTRAHLRAPVESVSALPGLRLIPYKSVGKNGFLLAMRLADVKIGKWRGNSLVAFAPEGLSSEGAYQALTGGVL